MTLLAVPLGVATKSATDVIADVEDLCDGVAVGDNAESVVKHAELRGISVVPLDNGGYLFEKRNFGAIPLMACCQVTVDKGRIASKEHFVD